MNSERPHRSALTDYPGGQAPHVPTVTVVIPVYNEIEHIQALIDAMLAQDYAGLTAICFVDGLSEDGTYTTLQQMQARDPRINVLCNPRRIQAAGINLGFAQADSDIVMRLDGHARYAPNVVRCSVEALLATGAGGVGAIARPLQATTLVGQSIVAAHTSRLGVGAAQFRQTSAKGWVDTVWNGCYWKYIAERVGPLREDLPRTEDNDFHERLHALGYGVYLSPDIEAYYRSRQSLTALWRQYWSNGMGIAQTIFINPRAVRLRHLAPFMLIGALIFLVILASFWMPALYLLVTLLLTYGAAMLVFTLWAWRQQPGAYALILPIVFAILHFSYGLGTAWGMTQWQQKPNQYK